MTAAVKDFMYCSLQKGAPMTTVAKERGRPRKFDRDQVLRQAMEVFLDRGYDGASIGDLTTAMGINAPSLYAAFGCKEALFREAVAHYDATVGAGAATALRDEPTAEAAIAALLRHNAVSFTDPDKPHGCLIVLAATTYNESSHAVHGHLVEWRLAAETNFRERIERGIADGDVPEEVARDRLTVEQRDGKTGHRSRR